MLPQGQLLPSDMQYNSQSLPPGAMMNMNAMGSLNSQQLNQNMIMPYMTPQQHHGLIHGKKALRENSMEDLNLAGHANQNASTMFTSDPFMNT